MFGIFKKKESTIQIGAPVKGTAVPIQEVSDPTFGEEILGKGVAVRPADGNICAPADGEIAMLFDTLHAVSLVSEDGAEILVHVGLDTVALKGQYFTTHVKTGDKVKKGDLMLTVDIEQVKAAGYDVITPMVICNTDDFGKVEAVTGTMVSPGDTVIELTKK